MDPTIEVPGPWQHRNVAANGARFHVAECGHGPLVLFLHGFPEFWWAWREQLPALAGAGFRAVAMDLRGYGSSDKTPRGYDPATLAADVVGVIRSLGARDAALVGQGWGGYIAWAVASMHPGFVRSLVPVAATHPLHLRRLLRSPRLARHLLGMQVPWVPERRIRAHEARYVEHLLTAWSAPGSAFPDPEAARRYRAAMSLWPSPHCALEYHRWVMRSRLRADGRRFAAAMRSPVRAPVLQVLGGQDAVVPRSATRLARSLATGPRELAVLEPAGHFPHEECPQEFTATLLDWLTAR
ncbi:MAG: alpha/beta hydrolase [Actinomycetota bacterium]|nr:alpha/beta hydrolase [Actinomycetota bacterium]